MKKLYEFTESMPSVCLDQYSPVLESSSNILPYIKLHIHMFCIMRDKNIETGLYVNINCKGAITFTMLKTRVLHIISHFLTVE